MRRGQVLADQSRLHGLPHGAIRRTSGNVSAPECRMSSPVITLTAAGTRSRRSDFLETEVTLMEPSCSRLIVVTSAKSPVPGSDFGSAAGREARVATETAAALQTRTLGRADPRNFSDFMTVIGSEKTGSP